MNMPVNSLKIHNSASGRKETFTPLVAGEVRMYVCGMTVYDYCHLGHARVMVVFDTVVRYLRSIGYKVTYVRNITDVDDKIIERARASGEDFHALTQRFIDIMHADAAALGILEPDMEPRATAAMDAIIAMIGKLLETGYAYQADNGDVYYDVSRFQGYGSLSGKRIEDLRAGSRVAVDESKDDPLDFVLWKAAKAGEPSWHSPWGDGRPGWHIECSAMSTRCLGPHFDIHGGGMDLKFPHHENEIAQSEAATGEHFVNYWMHNGFVRVDEEKMSKSLGNFFTVREILARYRAEEVRYFILASHYRSPLNYSQENLDNSKAALARLYTTLRGLSPLRVQDAVSERYAAAFHQAMDDDFNTPEAIAVLFEIAREINRNRESRLERANELAGCLFKLGGILGLLQSNPDDFLKGAVQYDAARLGAGAGGHVTGAVVPSEEKIQALIDERTQARKKKDWAVSDRIRDELEELGVLLEDSGEDTTWRLR